MGLAISVFVPEGIIIACDGLAEIKNAQGDQGFLHKQQKCLFSFENKYLVCIQGGYVKGLPYAYYLDRIFMEIKGHSFSSTREFSIALIANMKKFLTIDESITCYIAGNDHTETGEVLPMLYLLDKGCINLINKGNNDKPVYNYHSIGRNTWIDKLLLPTIGKIGTGENIDFGPVDIDFSKYSIDEAIDFAKTLIQISSKMDEFIQLTQMIGEYKYVGILPTYEPPQIHNL